MITEKTPLSQESKWKTTFLWLPRSIAKIVPRSVVVIKAIDRLKAEPSDEPNIIRLRLTNVDPTNGRPFYVYAKVSVDPEL